MHVVIFEMTLRPGQTEAYLDVAADLRSLLENVEGFISVERFSSLSDPDKLLSLSFWRDEAAIDNWRQHHQHRDAQSAGRQQIFAKYRLSVAAVSRQYGLTDRQQAPIDALSRHG
jgi:heme-degrading monooxygenase HmoA